MPAISDGALTRGHELQRAVILSMACKRPCHGQQLSATMHSSSSSCTFSSHHHFFLSLPFELSRLRAMIHLPHHCARPVSDCAPSVNASPSSALSSPSSLLSAVPGGTPIQHKRICRPHPVKKRQPPITAVPFWSFATHSFLFVVHPIRSFSFSEPPRFVFHYRRLLSISPIVMPCAAAAHSRRRHVHVS